MDDVNKDKNTDQVVKREQSVEKNENIIDIDEESDSFVKSNKMNEIHPQHHKERHSNRYSYRQKDHQSGAHLRAFPRRLPSIAPIPGTKHREKVMKSPLKKHRHKKKRDVKIQV